MDGGQYEKSVKSLQTVFDTKNEPEMGAFVFVWKHFCDNKHSPSSLSLRLETATWKLDSRRLAFIRDWLQSSEEVLSVKAKQIAPKVPLSLPNPSDASLWFGKPNERCPSRFGLVSWWWMESLKQTVGRRSLSVELEREKQKLSPGELTSLRLAPLFELSISNLHSKNKNHKSEQTNRQLSSTWPFTVCL